MSDVSLRPRAPDDDDAIVEIVNQEEGDVRPLSVDEYREGDGERYVAERDGKVAGHLEIGQAWWTGRPDIYRAEIVVDRAYRRLGVGTALHGLLSRRASNLGATRILGWVREDLPESRGFATRRGFEPGGEVLEEYRLDLRRANVSHCRTVGERLEREGIRICRLSEIDLDNSFLRRLQFLWADSGDAPPDPAVLAERFDTWRAEVIEGAGLSPDRHWVALDDDRPVGMTFLKMLSPGGAENDYTGTAREYRGRGIARALKGRAIAWGQEHGLRWFYTSSVVVNAPMIALNRDLGYEPTVSRIQVTKALPPSQKV